MTNTEIYNLLVAVANRQTTPELAYEKMIQAKAKKIMDNLIFYGTTILIFLVIAFFTYSCYHSNA